MDDLKKSTVFLIVVGIVGVMTLILWNSSVTTVEPYLQRIHTTNPQLPPTGLEKEIL
ncbi:hypothetical protein [Thermococcus sp.]